MPEYVILLSIPGLRGQDFESMPRLRALTQNGDRAELAPTLPAVTCAVQANMTTGAPPREHGVVGNGFFWRQRGEVEMWTSPNDCILRPQLWDLLHQQGAGATSAVWFPLHSKGCGADYVCTPAPIHNPDGSESLWCYTKPESLYGDLIAELGHFPLQHFWGPIANIKSTAWIVASAVRGAHRFRPNLFYAYLPHLDYAAQKFGPDSNQAIAAVAELDVEIGRMIDGFAAAYGNVAPLWLVASEYVITPVDHVLYPNRLLRDAGLLSVKPSEAGEVIDFAASRAGRWPITSFRMSSFATAMLQPSGELRTCSRASRAWPRSSRRGSRHSTTWPTNAAANWWSSANPTVGRPTIGGPTTPKRRPLLVQSTSIANLATTRWSCSSIPARRASRSTPLW